MSEYFSDSGETFFQVERISFLPRCARQQLESRQALVRVRQMPGAPPEAQPRRGRGAYGTEWGRSGPSALPTRGQSCCLSSRMLVQKEPSYACKLLTRKVTGDLTVVAVFAATYIAAYPLPYLWAYR